MIPWSNSNMDHVGLKSRSLGHICLKHCSPSRGLSFASILIRFYQNVCLDNILIKFEFGSCWVKTVVTRSNFFKTVFTFSRYFFFQSSRNFTWMFDLMISRSKKVREKSRDSRNRKPQPFPDTKRKRKQTKPNKRKSNKRTKCTKISSREVIAMLKGLKNTRTKLSSSNMGHVGS